MKHGRYSKIKRAELRDLIAQYEADPDPLNLLPELATTRALLQDYIDRYEETKSALLAWHQGAATDNENQVSRPRQVLDIADAHRLVSEVTKIAKRIEDIRARDAVSRSELFRLMAEMGRVVDTAASVLPPDTRDDFLRRVQSEWMAIRL